MRYRFLALAIAFALPGLGRAVPSNPIHDVVQQEVVYTVPGMDRVEVRQDVPYEAVQGGELKLDLYYPPDHRSETRRPAVVFINGVGDRPDSKLKNWGIYKSWGRLVAASGWIGVTFEAVGNATEIGSHVRHVFAFLRKEGPGLGVDPDRIAAWVCSANVSSGLPVLMDGGDAGVLGAVVYYGDAKLSKIRTDLPVFYVRAGKDSPRLNSGIDALWAQAVAAGAPWEMVNAPQSHHAFDALDETEESRHVVRATLDFYRDLFAPPAPPAPPSTAKKALSHWFGGREYPEAAKAYAEYVRTHPHDGEAWLRLGISQAHTGDPAAATSLDEAVKQGADSPTDFYNVACGFALLGRKTTALDWLERAVSKGFDGRGAIENDTDLASLHGEPRFQALLAKMSS